MATVYLARDVRHDRRVAIKVMRPELAAVIGAERFLAEIRTTANLQHPHILGLIDSGEADGVLWYAMPYVDGESLRAMLAREKQLPVAQAVRIASEIASALDYAHRHGVIHRDIKPENILLHDGGALVADFGIALAASKAGTRMTETGMSLGTPQYMSPEQAMGERELDARTDIYALGCVSYEMLTGEPPFSGPTAQAIVAKVMTATPVPVGQLRSTVPPSVQDAIATALQKLPADRFSTAAEFAAALTQSMPPRPMAAARRESASPQRRFIAVVLAVAALLAAVLLGRRWGSLSATPVEYDGQRLGGSVVAQAPRVSPDGQSIAFAAMVNGQTQVAVLKPATAELTVLTHDTSGTAGEFSWSSDGTRIYYSVFAEVPRGVFSITALGGDERRILENAGSPEALPDGSLLVARLNAARMLQMYRLWPETGRLDTLDATSPLTTGVPFFRAFHDGREAAFYGFRRGDTSGVLHLYAIDLASKNIRRLGGKADLSRLVLTDGSFGIARDDKSVLVDLQDQGFHRVVAVPRDGSSRLGTLFSFTSDYTNSIDAGPDGAIYVDEASRPAMIVQYDPVTHHVVSTAVPATYSDPLAIDHDRLLVVDNSVGRQRIMVLAPGKAPVPLLAAAAQESAAPLARLGSDRVLLVTVDSGHAAMAVVSLATGRVVTRFPAINPAALAGSPDGSTIYFVREGKVWSVPATGGTPRTMHDGDAVAVDPHGKYVVVQLDEASNVRLVQVPLNGDPEVAIAVHSTVPLAPLSLSPEAIGPDGRIVVRLAPPSNWFWAAGILDPVSGMITPLPVGPDLDVGGPHWDAAGRIVALGQGLASSLWRYRPRTGVRP
jgi:hypothetical protein